MTRAEWVNAYLSELHSSTTAKERLTGIVFIDDVIPNIRKPINNVSEEAEETLQLSWQSSVREFGGVIARPIAQIFSRHSNREAKVLLMATGLDIEDKNIDNYLVRADELVRRVGTQSPKMKARLFELIRLFDLQKNIKSFPSDELLDSFFEPLESSVEE